MNRFESIIILGDSWSWGSELPNLHRTKYRFDTLLAEKLNVESINLARESATNFCYKWHWIDWLNTQTVNKNSLVLVGITGPNRHLIWNNSADSFQESPGRLVSEDMVTANWGNQKQNGGFIRAFPSHIDFPDAIKKQCQENFYRFNYDEIMAEIYSIWEIKLLHLLIKEHGAYPIFWSNFHQYKQIEMSWAKTLLKDCQLVNSLQPFAYQKEHFYHSGSHPNEAGHAYIADILYQNISG
jgi:hypothetical protein